jgi:hypothetical protein
VCDICNNINVLLHGPATQKLTPMQRDIVRGYRSVHLRQQHEARLRLDQKIRDSYNMNSNGQPISAVFLADGMTEWTSK